MIVRPSTLARATLGGLALSRLARAARTRRGIRPSDVSPVPSDESISIVIPARDESTRLGPLLRALAAAPGVVEVIVVDDQSSDDTAELAERFGCRVIAGRDRPAGWAGKPWALQQGIEAASGDWIVTLDADTRPDRSLPGAIVARASADGTDILTVAGRFDCPTAAGRWLHAALLTTLVYRFGPPGAQPRPATNRTMANGQCMTFRRERLLAAGGLETVAGEVVEDVALVRHLAARGWSVDFLDASDLLTVRMYESLADTWGGWGRSIALPGVEPRRRQLLDLAVIVAAQALPLPRLLLRRADVIDLVLLAARSGTLVGTRRAYQRADAGYWLSPLADVPAACALGLSVLRRRQTWRGRSYTV